MDGPVGPGRTRPSKAPMPLSMPPVARSQPYTTDEPNSHSNPLHMRIQSMITLRAPTQLRAVLAFVIAEQIITRPRGRRSVGEERGPGPVLKPGEALVLSWASRLERDGPVLAPQARWTVENLWWRALFPLEFALWQCWGIYHWQADSTQFFGRQGTTMEIRAHF